jgi:Tetratricopeptide repeat
MANLASTYRNQGRWTQAEELDVQVMETRKRLLGPEHPGTLTSMNNLAYTFKSQNRDEDAVTLMYSCMNRVSRFWRLQDVAWHFLRQLAYFSPPPDSLNNAIYGLREFFRG